VGTAILAAVLWLAIRRARLGLGDAEPGAWRRPDWALWRELLAIGAPVSASRAAGFAAQLVFVQIVAREGTPAVAGYGIASALVLFGAVVTLALGQACGVVIGQSLGAELPARARAALRAGLAGAVLVAGGLVALTLAVDPVIGLFTTDPEIAAEAARALAILRWALFGIGAWQVLLMTFAALKATGRASALTIAADVAGLGFAALWPGTSSLVAVSLGFCVACWLKAGLLLVLIRVDRAAATRMGHPSR
jgi:Na+-driven multidrug efflux pump